MIVLSTEPRITNLLSAKTDIKKFKFSPYIFKVQTDDGSFIISNTFTRFVCAIKPEIARDIQRDAIPSEAWINSLSQDYLDTFVYNRILIDASTDETNTYLETYSLFDDILSGDSSIDRYNILTSTGCNARCYYCFEEGYYPKAEHMSIDTAEKVAAYILRTHDRSKKIYLRWFGGEPLVNVWVIDRISSILNNNKVDFFSTISTNGLLCTPSVIEKAKTTWRMSKVRITLDGWGREHDIRKRFVSTKDGFSVIMKNIDFVVKSGMIMIIRLSVDRNNHDSLMKLTEYFIERYKGCDNFKMYAHCLHDDVTELSFKEQPDVFAAVNESCDKLTKRIMEAGMYDYERLQPDGFRMYLCAAQEPKKISITPSGKICKCECLSNDQVSWGTVDGVMLDKKIFDYWHKGFNVCREKCRHCFMLPLCTPFSICPLRHLHCQSRFEKMLKFNLLERYRRKLCNEEPMLFIDCLPINIDFS